jgi:hypothetical protein
MPTAIIARKIKKTTGKKNKKVSPRKRSASKSIGTKKNKVVREFFSTGKLSTQQHPDFIKNPVGFIAQPDGAQDSPTSPIAPEDIKLKKMESESISMDQTETQVAAADQDKKRSRPYVIEVENTTDRVQDVILLGNYEVNKDKMHPGVKIFSGIPGVDYRELLWQLLANPVVAGMVYVYDHSNSRLWIMKIVSKDANGIKVEIPLMFPVDPYQQQPNISVTEEPFCIDGLTNLTFEMLPKARLSFRIYPYSTINPAREFKNQSPVIEYSKPNVIR